MNRNALKTYAPIARLDFIRAVTDRAAFFGLTPGHSEAMQETGDVVIIGGRPFPRVVAQQRRSLEARIISHGFDQVMEAIAYTWFNRFMALRYMELHGYLDHGYRVLGHPEGGVTPEILEHAEHVTLPGLDTQKVIELKLAGNQDAELYRMLLVAQCNALHEAMPFLFEKIADATELLLPDNLLHTDSIIRKLVYEIEEADWQQVEIIGWLYQFYISDKKDEVIGKVVKSEDIPAATQLFTPNWIVKYLVQNTLGRQWLATYSDSPLRQQMEYYIEPAEQADDVKAHLAAITPKSLDPEKLTLLDDACGSCHILVEAYDLFKAIYQERGYRSKDIPRLILQKNLFGLEIDDRAAQLGAFALLMKARTDDHRIFADRVQPNIVAIQDSKGLESLLTPDQGAAVAAGEPPFGDGDLFTQPQQQITLNRPTQESPLAAVEPCLRELIKLFEHGKTFGSLIRVPPDLTSQLPAARQYIEAMMDKGQLWEYRVATLLLPLVKQAELLSMTYDAVATNPPYMGSKNMNVILKDFTDTCYPGTRADLFAMFIERGFDFAHPGGASALVTMQSWMFLSSFEKLRERVIMRHTIQTLAHLGAHAFGEISGEVVQTTAFALLKRNLKGYRPVFFRLVDGDEEQKRLALARQAGRLETTAQEDFQGIPGSPIAYWASKAMVRCFAENHKLNSVGDTRQGMATTDNERFLRYWFEVDFSDIFFGCTSGEEVKASGKRWVPYNKGGTFRKWAGNTDYVINWKNDGAEIVDLIVRRYGNSGKRITSRDRFFQECISWSKVAGSDIALRHYPKGFIFDVGGCSIFFEDHSLMKCCLGLLNSAVARLGLQLISPTLNYEAGHLSQLPLPKNLANLRGSVVPLVEKAVGLARNDWNSFETAWEFAVFPLLRPRLHIQTLSGSWNVWANECLASVERLRQMEMENNRIFISAYELDGQISPQVIESEIAHTRANPELDMQRLISYAIGCMMGRYSLDKPGLVYGHRRNEGFDPSQYRTFAADTDGIIPITELVWFTDDATERFVEFIGRAWPREHLEENLKFIADSLSFNRDEHPRDSIRRYLATGFYKNHLQTYKRRPIYWLFSSGKQKAFQCLVYLHRYHEGTLARMRTEYVIPLQGKMSHRIEQLDGDIAATTSTAHRRKLEKERESLVKQRTELASFDEKLRHYADQRIDLDLDDGVKVNYAKFGDLLAEVKAVTGGAEE